MAKSAMEFRAVAKFDRPGSGRVLRGTVIPYNAPSEIAGAFREEFKPGSITVHGDPVINVQHRRDRMLARAGRGLTLTDGPEALRAELTLPNTREGDDVLELVHNEVLTGFSAEFRVSVGGETFDAATRLRTITKATLFGLAVVDTPGHTGARIDEIRAQIEADESYTAVLEGYRRWRF